MYEQREWRIRFTGIMSDKVFARGLELMGSIGVFESEKKIPQRYLVDIEVELDLREAGCSDELSTSVDYSDLCSIASKVMEECAGRNLIESYAEALASEVLGSFEKVAKTRIRVSKPDVEIGENRFQSVGIEIERERE